MIVKKKKNGKLPMCYRRRRKIILNRLFFFCNSNNNEFNCTRIMNKIKSLYKIFFFFNKLTLRGPLSKQFNIFGLVNNFFFFISHDTTCKRILTPYYDFFFYFTRNSNQTIINREQLTDVGDPRESRIPS